MEHMERIQVTDQHHQHPQAAGDPEVAAQLSQRTFCAPALIVGFLRSRAHCLCLLGHGETGIFHHLVQCLRGDDAGQVGHTGLISGKIHRRLHHTGSAAECLFNARDACRTTDAFNGEAGG